MTRRKINIFKVKRAKWKSPSAVALTPIGSRQTSQDSCSVYSTSLYFLIVQVIRVWTAIFSLAHSAAGYSSATWSDRLSALAVDCLRFDLNQHEIRLEGVIIIVNDETYFKWYARMALCIPDHLFLHISSPSIFEINLPGRGIKRVVSIYSKPQLIKLKMIAHWPDFTAPLADDSWK